jgi:hypothetical protein
MRDNRLRENRVRETNRPERQEGSGWLFGGSALGTVLMGLILAIIAIYYFRAQPSPAAPPAPAASPEVRVVDRPVPERPVAPVAPKPVWDPPPKQPEPARIETVPVWVGIWRPSGLLRPKKPLFPMVELGINGTFIIGKYNPNWSAVHPLESATIIGNSVMFTVKDEILRAHFRLTMAGTNVATLEGWVTDADWLEAVENANRRLLIPQQALAVRITLTDVAKRRGKVISLGAFERGSQ